MIRKQKHVVDIGVNGQSVKEMKCPNSNYKMKFGKINGSLFENSAFCMILRVG